MQGASFFRIALAGLTPLCYIMLMPHPSYHTQFVSPFGTITLTSDGNAVTALRFASPPINQIEPCPLLQQAEEELRAYFAGDLTRFSVPLRPEGTPFQQAVWQQLMQIPFGERVSYRDIASAVGNPSAVRAVGSANARNPIALMIPCHRVVKSDGHIGGYAYGEGLKIKLLEWERPVSVRGR